MSRESKHTLGLAAAACTWYRETLARRHPGTGAGGYPAESRSADQSLLIGATGIALGLLAAVSPVEPRWDRALLIDLAT